MITDTSYPIFILTITVLACFIWKKRKLFRGFASTSSPGHHPRPPWELTAPPRPPPIFFLYYPLGNFRSFFALSPPKNPKTQDLKKWKNLLEISSFYICVPKISNMMYGSWDVECNRQNVLSLWTIFCPFTPLWTQKIKILKNWKKPLEISSLYTSVPKIMIICCTVP